MSDSYNYREVYYLSDYFDDLDFDILVTSF